MNGCITLLTFGDLIQQYRLIARLTLTQLSNLSGVSKGTISKIENGEVKKPEFQTIKMLASALGIPYNEYIGLYIEVERRPDTLLMMLQEAISRYSPISLIIDIASKFLESDREDSYDVVERLYHATASMQDTSIKLTLYQLIIDYCREHGIMPFIAKGLYQKYSIERNDFSKLNATFQSGKYILNYINLLSMEERLDTYYKLGVHAYSLCMFQESIKLCSLVVNHDHTDSKLKIKAIGILQDAYYYIGDYETSQKYLSQYQKYPQSFVPDNVRLLTAMLNVKKGNHTLAVTQFQECLDKCSDDFVIYVINEFVSFYLEIGNLSAVEQQLNYENRINAVSYQTPLESAELARLYKLKGNYYSAVKEFNQAANNYMESAYRYAKIDDMKNERNCMRLLFKLYRENKQMMTAVTIEKIENFYALCNENE
ncbi:helix-turn-helix domain-containing protein [Paenibacillus agilis]|uniref:Helix-turn-helix domain-containing protein n=1 Tax=Paenibacillus agilis TaxID=3020863 RepID=A0A559IZY7_9BACL|nr:helix-turn-helix transcriptional regulator [Paenibacillus agilis]TVX93199.1 helix-turn-helix domain-containing protein [Paenibacillus agilis]